MACAVRSAGATVAWKYNGDPSHADPARLVTLCRRHHIEAHKPAVAPDVAAWQPGSGLLIAHNELGYLSR